MPTAQSSMAPLSEASKRALARLKAYTPPPTSWHSAPVSRRAAVLILLFPDKFGELRVVLTMRSSSLSSYSGQAALPGGKADSEAETPFDCARREAEEEIGLPRDSHPDTKGGVKPAKKTVRRRLPRGFWVEELCEMPTNLARTELVVRPCVAFLHNTRTVRDEHGKPVEINGGSVEENMLPQLDAREVAAVFSAPFRNFLYTRDLATVSEEVGPLYAAEARQKLPQGPWYQGAWTDWHQQRWRMHNFFVPVTNQPIFKPHRAPYEKQQAVADHLDGLERFKVWGMTARILVDAARYAYGQEPEFEHNAHFGDEEMINRLRRIGKFGDLRKPGEVLTNEDLRRAANL